MAYPMPTFHAVQDQLAIRPGERTTIVDYAFDFEFDKHDLKYAIMLVDHPPLPEPHDQLYTEVGYQSSHSNTVVAAECVNSKWRYLQLAPCTRSMLTDGMRKSKLQTNRWYGFKIEPVLPPKQNLA